MHTVSGRCIGKILGKTSFDHEQILKRKYFDAELYQRYLDATGCFNSDTRNRPPDPILILLGLRHPYHVPDNVCPAGAAPTVYMSIHYPSIRAFA
eukprot:1183464-Prorocentrum_minimum.AAC.2